MVWQTFRGLFQLIGVLTAGLLIMVAVAAWRLSAGEISLSYLTSYFEDALNGENADYNVRFKDTILAWSKERSILEIRVRGVEVAAARGGVVAEIPEMSVSLSGRALLRGKITPRRLAVFGPQLTVIRQADGSFKFGRGDAPSGSENFAYGMIAELIAPEDRRHGFRDLNQFSIVDGDLTIDDRLLNTVWRAPVADITLTRTPFNLIFEATVDVQTQSRYATITLDGQYAIDGDDFHFDAEFVNVNPNVFAELSPALKPLEMVNAPLTGSVSVATGRAGRIDAVEFRVSAGQGGARIEQPVATELKFMAAEARGRYDAARQTVEIADLTVDFGKNGTLKIPDPVDHVFPVRMIHASGTYDGRAGTAVVPRLQIDMDGPVAVVTLSAQFTDDTAEISTRALARRVPVTGIERYWPLKLGDLAHDWVVNHMAGGTMPEGWADATARWTRGKGFELTKLAGEIHVRNTAIDYLAPMPKARKVNADATFDLETFDFQLTTGEAAGLVLKRGRVLFTGLDQIDQFADIDLDIEGRFSDALAMIDHEPLGFARAVGIVPGNAKGQAAVNLKLKFLAERAMTVERIKIGATAQLTEIHVPKLVLGLDLSFGRMNLVADNQGMDVTGTAWLGTMAIDLGWRENFLARDGPSRVYRVTTRIDDIQRIAELGFDTPPFTREFMTGPADAVFDIVYRPDGKGRLDAEFILNEMALALPEFGWSKPARVPGKANVSLALDGVRMTGIDNLAVDAGDLVVDASGRFDDAGTLDQMTFRRLAFGNSDLAGTVSRVNKEWHVGVKGKSVDLIEWLAEDEEADRKEEKLPPLKIVADIDRVLLAPERHLDAFRGTLEFDGKIWRSMTIDAVVGEGKKVEIGLRSKNGKRNLRVTSDDAGATLRALDFYDDMVGGTLELTGTFDANEPDAPLSGRAVINKYRVVNAPLLAHLLSIAALTGIVEALSGDGLSFDIFEAPFVYDKGVARVIGGRASGPSLGVTASGVLDTNNASADLEGTIVPAYAINSVFGKLPVIGNLLTGGEKGGGVFAANYSLRGPLEKPNVTVNPLSILTPGFLRKIFGFIPDIEPTGQGGGADAAPRTN